MATLLDEEDVLVPIRIDLIHKGTHYIDTFTWNLYNSVCSIEEFVIKLCSDLNFPVTFVSLISSQMYQQIDSYFILFSLLYHNLTPNLLQQVESLIIDINLREKILDYSDQFQYNPNSHCCNPEKFAQVTCSDLGLPPEMEPTIAFNIREATIRQLLKAIEDSNSTSMPVSVTDIVSTLNLGLASSKNSVEMSTSLWKDTKPGSADAEMGGLYPVFPEHGISNSVVWQNE